MAALAKTASVPHLGGISVGYWLSRESLDRSLPFLVLFNPFTTTADYYIPEFKNKSLTEAVNLIAVELLGHGVTQTKTEQFNYWDSAIMTLQLLDALGIDKFFALGTSQGGWVAVRMALLAPARVKGVIPIGSSMDFESPRSRELGSWDGPGACSGLVTLGGNLAPAPDFEPDNGYYDFLMEIGYGATVDKATKDYWSKTIRDNYHGDEGKKRICMAAVVLASRDGLYERLPYVTCPVLWLQGTGDVVFNIAQAREEIKLFTNSTEAKLVALEGGVHFLSWTHEKEVHQEVLNFIQKWKGNERSVL